MNEEDQKKYEWLQNREIKLQKELEKVCSEDTLKLIAVLINVNIELEKFCNR